VKGFYSPVDKLAAELPRTKGTGAEFMTELSKRPGYKPQEAQDRDLQTLMALPKMAREEFLAKLKSKPAPQLEETTLAKSILRNPGLNVDPDSSPKYEEHTLPGGSNYREILMRMPHDEQRAKEFSDPASGHWDEPNVLAHVRAKDRTGPNGEKLLHIEEIQSDWHQQGREHGYATPETLKEFRAAELRHKQLKRQLDEAKAQSESAENSLKRKEPLFQQPDVRERYEAARVKANNDLMDLMPQVMKAQAEMQDFGHKMNSMVPNAPFKKNWHEMALKKMIHHAAENGYHGIVITPGTEQSKRYDLSRHVSRVTHMTHRDDPESGILFAFDPAGRQIVEKHNVPHSELPDYIGKEGAQKLLEQKPDETGYRELSGQNLQVGGEGMKGFYDKIVPSFLNQFGKKYGAQVGTMPIESKDTWAVKPKVTVLHHFPITPEMREDVTKHGVPLYAKGGEVEVKSTSYDPNLQRRHPELEEAIRGVAAGKVSYKQLDKLIAKHKPVKPYEFVPKPATLEDAQRGLNKNQIKAWLSHHDWPEGNPIGGRLDINAYEHHGVWANSIHDESGEKRPTSYGPTISIKNVTFDPNPGKSEEVGTGEKRKSPFARIKGELHHMSEDDAVQHMVDNLHHPDYAQIGFDPRRHGHFYDRKTLQPVTHSPHVVQIGPLALAYKPTYGKRENYATGGDVKPVGYTKEKVTVSPDLDQMRYELISVKHSKKVK
jgi:hypothetical protein